MKDVIREFRQQLEVLKLCVQGACYQLDYLLIRLCFVKFVLATMALHHNGCQLDPIFDRLATAECWIQSVVAQVAFEIVVNVFCVCNQQRHELLHALIWFLSNTYLKDDIKSLLHGRVHLELLKYDHKVHKALARVLPDKLNTLLV